MRVLVIGGTCFLGRWLVTEALLRGHDVTIFHRGRHGRGSFAQAHEVLGDRRAGLEPVAGDAWDAVIDSCALSVADVGAAAALDSERLVLLSSVDAYDGWPRQAIAGEDDPATGPVAAMEAAAGDRALCPRLGFLAGPFDWTNRLEWWIDRLAEGGPVLAPGPGDADVQLLDARDAARFVLDALEGGLTGPVNVVGPPVRWGAVLEAARVAAGGGGELAWVDGERLARALDGRYDLLPLWPAPLPEAAGLHAVGSARAAEAGLRVRPIAETVADAWAYRQAHGPAPGWRADAAEERLDARRELVLLTALT